jgi:hypothetical protein
MGASVELVAGEVTRTMTPFPLASPPPLGATTGVQRGR